MSRSRVKRGLAWRTTATPPTITKSTSASVRRRSRLPKRKAGWSSQDSGVFTATPRARQSECARLRVHRFESVQPLAGRQFELLADQALVHAAAAGRRLQLQAASRRPQSARERLEGRIRARTLQLRDRRLADSQAQRELPLRQPRLAAGVSEQCGRVGHKPMITHRLCPKSRAYREILDLGRLRPARFMKRTETLVISQLRRRALYEEVRDATGGVAGTRPPRLA